MSHGRSPSSWPWVADLLVSPAKALLWGAAAHYMHRNAMHRSGTRTLELCVDCWDNNLARRSWCSRSQRAKCQPTACGGDNRRKPTGYVLAPWGQDSQSGHLRSARALLARHVVSNPVGADRGRSRGFAAASTMAGRVQRRVHNMACLRE